MGWTGQAGYDEYVASDDRMIKAPTIKPPATELCSNGCRVQCPLVSLCHRALLNLILPSLLAKAVVGGLPPELGSYVVESGESQQVCNYCCLFSAVSCLFLVGWLVDWLVTRLRTAACPDCVPVAAARDVAAAHAQMQPCHLLLSVECQRLADLCVISFVLKQTFCVHSWRVRSE